MELFLAVKVSWEVLAPRAGAVLRKIARATAAGLALALGACNFAGSGISSDSASAPVPKVHSESLGAATPAGERIGTGPVLVGAILPLTQNGGPSVVGQSLRNAAQLAVEESGSNDITLIVEDDHSTPEGAAQAAQTVISAGAEIIVGPLFAADVREVGRVAKAANRPVIAFSTDASVASRGVYLLSFLIESYVDRIADFAVGRGLKSFAILAPQSDYGNVATAEFQSEAAKLNARVVTVARYAPGEPGTGIQEIQGAANRD